jgi:succinate dehydrogenase/fumarate reductase-like Fe-S protein
MDIEIYERTDQITLDKMTRYSFIRKLIIDKTKTFPVISFNYPIIKEVSDLDKPDEETLQHLTFDMANFSHYKIIK